MRVTVSLSDRIPADADWRHSAACRDMDPADFDDQGTPVAWDACKKDCLVVAECLADCFHDRPHGVYRAGRYWPEVGGPRINKRTVKEERLEQWAEYAHLWEQGMSLRQIATATGCHHTGVLRALRKMGLSA